MENLEWEIKRKDKINNKKRKARKKQRNCKSW
jgi:hypothetical protein